MHAKIRSSIFRVLLVSAVAWLSIGCGEWHVDDLTSDELEAEELEALREIVSNSSLESGAVRVYFGPRILIRSPGVQIKDGHVVRLHLRNAQLSDPSQFGAFSHLEIAALQGNNLESLESGEVFAGIERLDLSKNALTSVDALSGNESLERLAVDENNLRTLRLHGNESLEKLEVDENNLRTLRLQGMPNLQSLVASNNRLETVQLQELPHLTELDLDNNRLETLRGVAGLHSLKTLQASHNRIRAVDVLESGFPDLEELTLADNRIEDATVLEQVETLEKVHLQKNPLKRLPSNWRYVGTFNIDDTPAKSRLVANDKFESPVWKASDLPSGVASSMQSPCSRGYCTETIERISNTYKQSISLKGRSRSKMDSEVKIKLRVVGGRARIYVRNPSATSSTEKPYLYCESYENTSCSVSGKLFDGGKKKREFYIEPQSDIVIGVMWTANFPFGSDRAKRRRSYRTEGSYRTEERSSVRSTNRRGGGFHVGK